MATITLSYRSNNKYAKLAIDALLASGHFKKTEAPIEYRLHKAMQEAEEMAQDIRKNGRAGYQTIEEFLDELQQE